MVVPVRTSTSATAAPNAPSIPTAQIEALPFASTIGVCDAWVTYSAAAPNQSDNFALVSSVGAGLHSHHAVSFCAVGTVSVISRKS